MDTLPSKLCCGGGPTVGDGIPAVHARIFKACLVAGLSAADADDVAQDIWLWLLHSGRQSEALVTPWLGAVAQNFIRRYWRGRKRRLTREGQAVAQASVLRRESGPEALESRLSLDRMEERLPGIEAKLLHLVRRGSSFAQAVRQLGIPRGSRSFFRKRLIAHLAEGLRAPEKEARLPERPPPSPEGRVGRK